MHSLSAACRSHIDFRFSRGIIGTIAALSMCGCFTAPASAQDAASKSQSAGARRISRARNAGEQGRRTRSPPHRASRRSQARHGGHSGQELPLFDYQVIRGTPSDGQMSGSNLYPAPTLQVFPGETLIVHLENGLSGLTIRDYFSPQYTPKGETVPIYPEQMTSSPLNLHVHGVHVSPKGNADNVLLHIPAGMSNTYTYNIPKNHAAGSVLVSQPSAWPHRGANLYGPCRLARDRPHRRQPAAGDAEPHSRSGTCCCNTISSSIATDGLAQLNNPNWPQFVSSIKPPQGDELAKGTYRPAACPGQFQPVQAGREILHRLVCGAAFDPQRPRTAPVHPEQSAALHLA